MNSVISIRRLSFGLVTAALATALFGGSALATTVVALGASNTYGKGVSRGEAFPAQLQALLDAKGQKVTVVNAGINGDTTEGMLARLDGVLTSDTRVVILQPGGNDARKGLGDSRSNNIGTIKSRLAARKIRVVMLPNRMLGPLPHQADGQHLTPAGYATLAAQLVPAVLSALKH
jgi:acyl-CoA thioesterase-1